MIQRTSIAAPVITMLMASVTPTPGSNFPAGVSVQLRDLHGVCHGVCDRTEFGAMLFSLCYLAVHVTQTGWYLSGGIRIATITPFLTYSALTSSPTSAAGLNASTLSANMAVAAAALDAGLNQILGASPLQCTQSAGVRRDFVRNLYLKPQADHTRLDAGSHGSLVNVQPGFRFGGTVNLFSAAIDFVC